MRSVHSLSNDIKKEGRGSHISGKFSQENANLIAASKKNSFKIPIEKNRSQVERF
jgi:hypothetical protein